MRKGTKVRSLVAGDNTATARTALCARVPSEEMRQEDIGLRGRMPKLYIRSSLSCCSEQ